MGLTGKYTVSHGRIPDLFDKIRDAQAPDQVSTQLLKDWSFTSSNDRALIPLLKDLGFLTSDGKPTKRYNDYRDHSKSRSVMAEALRSAYGDLFLIKENPTESDRESIHGKFKSFHNVSDNVASLQTKSFFALLNLADLNSKHSSIQESNDSEPQTNASNLTTESAISIGKFAGLHYNIQIHLPATKDVEVYNAIFKSLKGHLIE
ncbi:MAG: DUF5343 domain-containing protein [Planctomycetota bacterium]